MIFLCEPQCKGQSHEKVNSGFLTALRTAYPDEPIRLYCHPTHAAALRAVLAHDGVELREVETRDFPVLDTYRVRSVLAYRRAFTALLREAATAGVDRVLFLSINPVLLHVLKRVHARPAFRAFRLAFVLHADFEDIANERFVEPIPPVPPATSPWARLREVPPWTVPRRALVFARHLASERYAAIWKARFREREELLRRQGPSYRYIALSPHVVRNAAAHLDVAALGVHELHMPINFAPERPVPRNPQMRFATFGFGDVVALKAVAQGLAARVPGAGYELRVIGMDTRGLAGLPGVTLPSPGKLLDRAEMERLAEDIDAFLILYGPGRYNLSCSGSIFEAFSYVKPVIHLNNACVREFDRPESPIGFGHDSLPALVETMAQMIEQPDRWREAIDVRRSHLRALREQLSMARLAPRLRAILSFA